MNLQLRIEMLSRDAPRLRPKNSGPVKYAEIYQKIDGMKSGDRIRVTLESREQAKNAQNSVWRYGWRKNKHVLVSCLGSKIEIERVEKQ